MCTCLLLSVTVCYCLLLSVTVWEGSRRRWSPGPHMAHSHTDRAPSPRGTAESVRRVWRRCSDSRVWEIHSALASDLSLGTDRRACTETVWLPYMAGEMAGCHIRHLLRTSLSEPTGGRAVPLPGCHIWQVVCMVGCHTRQVGVRLGQGESLDAILSSLDGTAEGVPTARALTKLVDSRVRGFRRQASKQAIEPSDDGRRTPHPIPHNTAGTSSSRSSTAWRRSSTARSRLERGWSG